MNHKFHSFWRNQYELTPTPCLGFIKIGSKDFVFASARVWYSDIEELKEFGDLAGVLVSDEVARKWSTAQGVGLPIRCSFRDSGGSLREVEAYIHPDVSDDFDSELLTGVAQTFLLWLYSNKSDSIMKIIQGTTDFASRASLMDLVPGGSWKCETQGCMGLGYIMDDDGPEEQIVCLDCKFKEVAQQPGFYAPLHVDSEFYSLRRWAIKFLDIRERYYPAPFPSSHYANGRYETPEEQIEAAAQSIVEALSKPSESHTWLHGGGFELDPEIAAREAWVKEFIGQ